MSPLNPTAGEPRLRIHSIASGFHVGSGDQTPLIAHVHLHPLIPLPSPSLGLSNVFLMNDLTYELRDSRAQWLSAVL